EDYALRAATPPARADEDIERVRRAHRNDLENILPFFVLSFLYVLTKPSYGAAAIYFWGFLAARVLHSIFYIRGAQPHRTIAFAVGAVLMFVMLLRTLVADRKSTRLNSSHDQISYAVFCLKKKKK